MILVVVLLAFAAGLACGLAMRPVLDRRRQLRRAYAVARGRRQDAGAAQPSSDVPAVPRDYYLADRRQRGTLSEGFGLKRRAEDRAADAAAEKDMTTVPMPRDYYDRSTPDDEGTLAEGYGLRGKPPGTEPGHS